MGSITQDISAVEVQSLWCTQYTVQLVSKSTWLFTSHTLSILSNVAFSHTNCAGSTVASMGTVCIVSVRLRMWMNPSIQSAQAGGSVYLVRNTTTYSWDWGCNIYLWVFLHLMK